MARGDGHGKTGRPSEIDAIVTRPDGSTSTVGEVIVQMMRAGMFFQSACNVAGKPSATGNEWLKVAGKARIRAKGRTLDALGLTAHEERCCAFSDEVQRAAADALARACVDLTRLSMGGIPTVTETVRVEADGSTTTTTRTEHTLPDKQVIMWWMSRRFPKLYGDHVAVTINDGADLSDEERLDSLTDSLSAYLAGVQDTEANAHTNGDGQ